MNSYRTRRRTGRALVLASSLLLGTMVTVMGAPAASAAPVCPGAGQAPVLVGSVPGAALEGAIVDGGGRLYTTDAISGRIFRLDTPGAAAVPVATVPGGAGAGGLAWAEDGSLLVGYGGGGPRVVVGDSARPGAVAKVDVATGAVTPFASGLSAANGLDVAPDGVAYATNDFATQIGRIAPDGSVDPDWAVVPSANGAAVTSDNRYLFVARTFANPGISRIPIENPGAPEDWVSLGGTDVIGAPDGLVLDSHDRPVVPANALGEIWRVDGPNQYCALATGLPLSSSLAYGKGDSGFSAGRLFRVGFDGAIYEIPGGFDG
ncbi:SMP-30/gluconolactonase/LRE family protein [Rhodococcus sp. NPDC058521]|uniref:SMP-30/gluconolactonase/LRE family protein n=1 Tax=Rhodococcus sp. NPDC058521 TaxID=3346536 RepID=UPI00365C0FAE